MNDAAIIPLTRGLVALVSPEDFERISAFKWLAQSTGNGRFYACRADSSLAVGGKKRAYLLMHRVVLNAPKGPLVDHINGDPLDNRRGNLRLCTPEENMHNMRKPRGCKLSRFKGVAFVQYLNRKNPWMAFIAASGKRTYLGYFPTEEDAARAYNTAALKLHGSFAHLNVVDEKARAA